MKDPIRIAMVGCGAVAEQFHLPAVQSIPGCITTLLVDTNENRTEALSKIWNIEQTSKDYREVAGKADAAIVALPHFLHETVVCHLLESGVDVLVEKPMATTYDECRRMAEAAENNHVCLAVGLFRRYFYSTRLVKRILTAGRLGRILKFDFREGHPYSWPVQSDFFFRRETAGGGVLLDTGAHTIDLLLWWLGEVAEFDYCDDYYGGVEADCLLKLKMQSGAEGVIELSRTRSLRNTAIIEGEMGTIEAHLHRNLLTLRWYDLQSGIAGQALGTEQDAPVDQTMLDLAKLQLQNWILAIRKENATVVTPQEAARSVSFIQQCYARRRLWQLPWVTA